MNLAEQIKVKCNHKEISQCSNEELYAALLELVQEEAAKKESNAGKKKVYYISAEFLIGKLLSNNLINLGLYDEARRILADHGKDICAIEEVEPEPSLGNGGLGRLAACFLDSMATLGVKWRWDWAELSFWIVLNRNFPTGFSGRCQTPGSRQRAG